MGGQFFVFFDGRWYYREFSMPDFGSSSGEPRSVQWFRG
jgi:hypothetical protein